MLILRRVNYPALRPLILHTNTINRTLSGKKGDESSDSDSDNEQIKKQDPKIEPIQQETAAERLNKLLAGMRTEENIYVSKQLNMAKPGGGKKRTAKENSSEDIFTAAKKVANLLDPEGEKQTEKDLINKLLIQTGKQSAPQKGETKIPSGDLNLNELIVGMKIDRTQGPSEYSRSSFVRKMGGSNMKPRHGSPLEQHRRIRPSRLPLRSSGSVDLFGSKPLDVFKDPNVLQSSEDILKTWNHLENHELKLSVTHPPANYYQKMAMWTEQGKLWKFPIDNEQGMDEEAAVDFSEHVFLDQHLEPWCPKKGPIRHFMELVCVGLSKNPYITAKEKKAHILWYRDYFEEKKDLLKEIIIDAKSERKTIEQ